MHKKQKVLTAILIAIGGIVGIGLGMMCYRQYNAEKLEPMSVTLLKVGKADAIVLIEKDKTMVIDAGEEEDGEELVEFLKNQGVSLVDTLIITHFDRDHVGGADTLVEELEIGQVIVPDYTGNSTEYLDFTDALQQKGIVPLQLTQSMSFALGEAVVFVEPPVSYESQDSSLEVDNNFSLITRVTHGKNTFLFMGDAEKKRIREWASSSTAAPCDFIKMPHHGVYNTALQLLINTTKPQYAAICSSNKHPADAETVNLLKQFGVQTFETKDGDVVVISDGNHLETQQCLDS